MDIEKFYNGDYVLGEPHAETPKGLDYASTGRPFNKEVCHLKVKVVLQLQILIKS